MKGSETWLAAAQVNLGEDKSSRQSGRVPVLTGTCPLVLESHGGVPITMAIYSR